MYDPETDAYLHDMCMVSMLSVDVYVKKKCIEHLIDDMHSVQEQTLKQNAQKAKTAEKIKSTEKVTVTGKAKTAEKITANSKTKAVENTKANRTTTGSKNSGR